ncbi:Apterous [Operophtera brumata]|uniref:Apterous n=1 Tax=Operophtera brumata TaxID=104452 RepID=A0A0L7L721_OPEBR|nr:Apterous [Operophtera brumata]
MLKERESSEGSPATPDECAGCGGRIQDRLFCVKQCARCGTGITANELVMRARDLVYHLACFSCSTCGVQLTKGDVFGMRARLVYCRPHYDAACMDEYCDDDVNNVYRCQDLHSEGDSPLQYFPGPSTKGRPRKRKLAQGSPEDMQVQSMRMASTALEGMISAPLKAPVD